MTVKFPSIGLLPKSYEKKGTRKSGGSVTFFFQKDACCEIRYHAIYWLICLETYESFRRTVVGYEPTARLIYEDEETCVYFIGSSYRVIVGFRGTDQSKDIYDDIRISLGKTYPRVEQAKLFLKEFSVLNPNVTIEVTGHSLGGAIARDISKHFGYKCVTFNAASPPSAPVVTADNETSFHICFDVISAWQSGNVIRLDKGFRPTQSVMANLTGYSWLYDVFTQIIASHSLVNFSSTLSGTIVNGRYEDKLFRDWYGKLSFSSQGFLSALFYIQNSSVGFPLIVY